MELIWNNPGSHLDFLSTANCQFTLHLFVSAIVAYIDFYLLVNCATLCLLGAFFPTQYIIKVSIYTKK